MVEQLDSVDGSGMFGQIAQGLKHCDLVIMNISKEYVDSKNCNMEAMFALRTLHRKVVVLDVGIDNDDAREAWKTNSVGMLTNNDPHFDLSTDASEDLFEEQLTRLADFCKKYFKKQGKYFQDDDDIEEYDSEDYKNNNESDLLEEDYWTEDEDDWDSEKEDDDEVEYEDSEEEEEMRLKKAEQYLDKIGIRVGGDVISYTTFNGKYYKGKVIEFYIDDEDDAMKYSIDFDNYDTDEYNIPYDKVAADKIPKSKDVGVNTEVLFEQGLARDHDGDDEEEVYIWHRGIITSIRKCPETGRKLYSGRHMDLDEDSDKDIEYEGYEETFEDYPLSRLRTFMSAYDALMINDML